MLSAPWALAGVWQVWLVAIAPGYWCGELCWTAGARRLNQVGVRGLLPHAAWSQLRSQLRPQRAYLAHCIPMQQTMLARLLFSVPLLDSCKTFLRCRPPATTAPVPLPFAMA